MNTQRMASNLFIAWCPNAVLLDHDSVEDVGFDLMSEQQMRNNLHLKEPEQILIANNSGQIANIIIERLMKGAK